MSYVWVVVVLQNHGYSSDEPEVYAGAEEEGAWQCFFSHFDFDESVLLETCKACAGEGTEEYDGEVDNCGECDGTGESVYWHPHDGESLDRYRALLDDQQGVDMTVSCFHVPYLGAQGLGGIRW